MHYLLKNLEVPARIGVYDSKKGHTQTIVLNVRFDFDATKAAASDDLADTLDYARIEALLRQLCVAEHYELLEKLQAVLWQQVMGQFPEIENLTVSIEKFPFETGSIVIK